MKNDNRSNAGKGALLCPMSFAADEIQTCFGSRCACSVRVHDTAYRCGLCGGLRERVDHVSLMDADGRRY